MKYASGLDHDTLQRGPDSIWDIVRERAEVLGDKLYLNFVDDGETLSYRQTQDRAHAVGRGLLDAGMKSGDKVGLLLSGSALHVLAWFGSMSAALVDVPINPEFRGEVLNHAIIKTDVTALIVDADGLAALRTASPACRSRLALVIAPDAVQRHAVEHGAVPDRIGRFLCLSDIERAGRAARPAAVHINPKILTSIRFSSGTTGLPKGVMMDHGHMLASARKFNDMMSYGPQDIMYTCFPFHHVFATVTGVLSTMCAGGSMIVARKFSASRYWDDIRKYQVTRAHLLDPLVPILMKQPMNELDRQHKLLFMYTAAGHYPEFEQRFGVSIIALYDMSELTVVMHYPQATERRAGSCGKESGLFEIRIVDEEGLTVPPGMDGEITVRPRYPNIMFLGYYNDADQTVERWRDLWFHTGDRGRQDADGFYYFLGRVGDRIRRRGVNVSAEQIEKAALAHDAILECAAIAVPSPLGEDDIKLCARLTGGSSLSAVEIADYLAGALPKALTVRYVEIFDQLPKTQTEKIQRAALRRLGASGLTASTWDHDDKRYCVAASSTVQ